MRLTPKDKKQPYNLKSPNSKTSALCSTFLKREESSFYNLLTNCGDDMCFYSVSSLDALG